MLNLPKKQKRLIFLLVIGSILICGGVGYKYYFLTRPIGVGPAGPVVSPEPFNYIWSESKVLLVGLGDSITAGYGASPQHSYFELISHNSDDEVDAMRGICLSTVLPKMDILQLAISGTTSLEHITYQLPKLPAQDAETIGVVVASIGGNDVIHNYGKTPPEEGAMYGATLEQAASWIANYEKRLNQIVISIQEKFPGGCFIFLANIYDPTDGIGDIENAGLPRWAEGLSVLEAYNRIIKDISEANEGVYLIDIHAAFRGHGIHCRQFWQEFYHSEDPYYWYFDNLENPNDRGYDAIRRLFLTKMAMTLPQKLKNADH